MKTIISIVAIVAFLCAMIFALQSEYALVVHPKGIIAKRQLQLMITNIVLMLVIIVPTMIIFLYTAWKYRASKRDSSQEHEESAFGQLMLWVVPSIIVAIMAVITWYEAHELDPYRPLKSDVKPITIQVVAMDWKWLFIYPELGIASLNFVQFPAETPINFTLA